MEEIPLLRPRIDALPEHTRYNDNGCDLYPSCLRCPLPRCRYEEPGGDPAAAVAQIKEEYDIAFEIYVIGILVDSRVRAHLQGIADAGAGIYFDVRSRAALNNALASIDLLVEGEEESTPPSDPIARSSSHTPNESSDDPTIDITWPGEGQEDGASDATGVDGYSWSFTEDPTDLPDTVKDGEEYVTAPARRH